MITVFTDDKLPEEYSGFIDSCIDALFSDEDDHQIYIEVSKFLTENPGCAGICTGDAAESTIQVATHWSYEDGEEYAYEPHELASNIAHELVHAKQFCREQINMIDNVWKHNGVVINCDAAEYAETPWEVEAYTYESILTDIFWEN